MNTGAGLVPRQSRRRCRPKPAEIPADRDGLGGLARSIPLGELRGATVTLSNFGIIGGRFANLVVVPPQVAIIGAGRISAGVIAHRGQPAVRRLPPLSLIFDHRVVTAVKPLASWSHA